MALKTFKPTTPSQRQLVLVDRSHLWKGKPVKALTEGLTKSGGRNNQGRISAWHRGGGHKRSYRMVDFKRGKHGMPATVERLEFDPNRTAFIALIRYEDGELAYILAPVITEKSSMASESNQVVFKVRRDATKPEIKAAVEQLFKVKVLSVNTILRKGKTKTFRGVRGKQQDVKKAIVKLAEGDKIDVTTRI